MSRKVAVLQMADQGPAESTAAMLRAVGYDVFLPDKRLRDELRRAGCSLVLSPEHLTRRMGYDPVSLPEIGPDAMNSCDVYCDVKAHKDYAALVARWPRLAGRVLWTRINGAAPEVVPGQGDEVSPPCPVLTANLHYGRPGSWADRSYACWIPFVRFDEYEPVYGRATAYAPPMCLVHGIGGWGYGALIPELRKLGVGFYGVAAPDGLLPHRVVPQLLSEAKCLVHLKSSDSPGFALYEAMAAACPVVCARRLIWRSAMESLLVPGETCLVFDRETHDPLSPADVEDCTREVAAHLGRLADPVENRRIGQAGRERLKAVMWSDRKPEDVESLRAFMGRHFGG